MPGSWQRFSSHICLSPAPGVTRGHLRDTPGTPHDTPGTPQGSGGAAGCAPVKGELWGSPIPASPLWETGRIDES